MIFGDDHKEKVSAMANTALSTENTSTNTELSQKTSGSEVSQEPNPHPVVEMDIDDSSLIWVEYAMALWMAKTETKLKTLICMVS